MRHNCPGKQAHHCNTRRIQEGRLCRYRRNRRKENALTGGDPGVPEKMHREVSRGHSSYKKRAGIDSRMAHISNEGLNIKLFQIRQGSAKGRSPVLSGTG